MALRTFLGRLSVEGANAPGLRSRPLVAQRENQGTRPRDLLNFSAYWRQVALVPTSWSQLTVTLWLSEKSALNW